MVKYDEDYNDCSNNCNECYDSNIGKTLKEIFFDGDDLSNYKKLPNGRYVPKYENDEYYLGTSLFD